MKRVLFIAYHFPPLAGGGTFRSLKFVKYLPEFGWLPTVLTTNTKNYWAYDETLLKEVPENVKIIRAGELDPFYLHVILSKIGLGKLYEKIKDRFFTPDEKIGWIPFAYRKAVKELRKRKYDLIFSTSPTPCAHIIGMKLKKIFKIPWVTDYRDLWTLNPEYLYSINSKRFMCESAKERAIAKISDTQIHVTRGNINSIYNHYLQNSKQLELIYNGFDVPTNISYTTTENPQNLHFVYTGTFYGERNPKALLQAISILSFQNPEISSRMFFQFVGKSNMDIINESKKLDIHDRVQYTLNLKRPDIDLLYQKANILVLIIPKNQDYILTSKIFDYLIVKKPILAIIPDGEAKEILQKANLGFFADPNSPDDIKKQVLHLYHLWETGQLRVNPNTEYIRQFHRRNLTKQLAEVFNSLT